MDHRLRFPMSPLKVSKSIETLFYDNTFRTPTKYARINFDRNQAKAVSQHFVLNNTGVLIDANLVDSNRRHLEIESVTSKC